VVSFDRVHHQRLLNRVGQQVCDNGVLNLVRQMLKAKVVLPDEAGLYGSPFMKQYTSLHRSSEQGTASLYPQYEQPTL
jgi:hypothetical protein